MDFLKNGTKVLIKDTAITGVIIGVCIRGIEVPTIEYHVQYSSGLDLLDKWLYSYLVEEYIEVSKQAGLVNYETGIQKA